MTETFSLTATELKRVFHNNKSIQKVKLTQLASAPFYITREVSRIDYKNIDKKRTVTVMTLNLDRYLRKAQSTS